MKNLDTILNLSRKIKVLYIEDNASARESTLGLLSNMFTDITVAVDGQEGFNKFIRNSTRYNLIISDMNMPNMDGKEMIKKIRKFDNNIKIFVLSAHNETESNLIDKVEAYLAKPIDFTKLLKEIENNF